MKIRVHKNWEDVVCPACRSELTAHPSDINSTYYSKLHNEDFSPVTFWVDCPVCDSQVPIQPPKKYQDRLIFSRWPQCPCEGDASKCQAHLTRGGCGECDWPGDLKYRSP